jgi:hypothetical protein
MQSDRKGKEFDRAAVEALLVGCHRRCCVCHRYCGVKIEVDHIEPAAEGGSGDIANAIPLCFECHAEVHHYNAAHPKGRRFTSAELRGHKKQWLGLCKGSPAIFVHAQPAPEAGSLERLLNELEFNRELAKTPRVCGAFEVLQFRRAIADGTFTWLPEELKTPVLDAYVALTNANTAIENMGHALRPSHTESTTAQLVQKARGLLNAAVIALSNAL